MDMMTFKRHALDHNPGNRSATYSYSKGIM